VSLQAKRVHKTALTAGILAALGSPAYLLSGEVSVSIEWMIHEHLRYETLGSPDVDNILKVVLDALCGPTGILINDCQVQSVSCHWIDWASQGQQVTITVRHSGDDWVRKKDLVFVRALGRLCWPMHLDLPPEAIATILTALDTMTKTNQELLKLSGDWYAAQGVMPVQRPFHSGRLRGFTIVTPDELRARVNCGG
jgi:Holliday junction resolvase RusA-like endonuclease